MFFINLSGTTIGDSSFPKFLQLALMEFGAHSAEPCFEIPKAELVSRRTVVAEFEQQVRQYGYLHALLQQVVALISKYP
jgi:EAL domain-containing protein (putative c-di-GMP-specific phosphodiesterase class I)